MFTSSPRASGLQSSIKYCSIFYLVIKAFPYMSYRLYTPAGYESVFYVACRRPKEIGSFLTQSEYNIPV